MIGKRISFKIGLILRNILMKRQPNLDFTDVERANALRKLRALMKMDMSSYAMFLGTTEDALDVMENLNSKIPSHLLLKAAAQSGINSGDMISKGRLDKIIDKEGFDYKALIPDHILPSEVFDLIHAYCLISRDSDRLNMLNMLRMLACDRPDTKTLCKAAL